MVRAPLASVPALSRCRTDPTDTVAGKRVKALALLQDLIATLVSVLLLQPLEAEVKEKLEGARVPQAVVTEVLSCARAAAPIVVQRAASDPVWAMSSVVRVWLGTARPEALLLEAAPGCGPAVAGARPFLAGRSA